MAKTILKVSALVKTEFEYDEDWSLKEAYQNAIENICDAPVGEYLVDSPKVELSDSPEVLEDKNNNLDVESLIKQLQRLNKYAVVKDIDVSKDGLKIHYYNGSSDFLRKGDD